MKPSAGATEFEFLPRVANVPPWALKPKDPPFVDPLAKTFKYVDDQIKVDKVNMRKAELLINNGVLFKDIIPKRSQALLRHISANAEIEGMMINPKKTSLMCVSAANSFEPRVTVEIEENVINGSDSLKVLGLTIDSNCSFRSHIEHLRNKMRKRTWALLKLKKAGLATNDLIQCYKSLIRPSVEYMVPVWHPMITSEQAASLENQQSQALKSIFDVGLSARRMCETVGIELLSKRRDGMCLRFAKNCLTNKRCQDWFTESHPPLTQGEAALHMQKWYNISFARTDGHRNSPKNYLRRLLNN